MSIFINFSVTIGPINAKRMLIKQEIMCFCAAVATRTSEVFGDPPSSVDPLICQHGAEGISSKGILNLASSTSCLHVEPL